MPLWSIPRCGFNAYNRHLVTQCTYRYASSKPTLAIRREDNSVWERRAPLSPSDIRHLIKQDINVIVQPSNRRAYSMEVSVTDSMYHD